MVCDIYYKTNTMKERLQETNRMRRLMGLPLITEQTDNKTNVIELETAIKGTGTNEEKVYQILKNISIEDFWNMSDYFQDKYGESVDEFIINDFHGKEKNKVRDLLARFIECEH